MKIFSKKNILIAVIIILLVINSIVLARVLGNFYLPGEVTALEKAKQGAQAVIKYSEDLADSYGVGNTRDVKNILAKFKYEVEKADGSEEVASLMVDYGRQIQDTIFREVQNKRINRVINIVNSQKLPKTGSITISSVDGKIKFVDPENILTEETKTSLKDMVLNQTIELKIDDKSARIVTPVDIFNQVDFLQTKVASLERRLNEVKQRAGFEKLSGPGIIIRVFDQEDQKENTGIVHSTDIRKIVDELLIAGAEGVEVGDQRLVATTPIRCVGPTLLVNNKPISVNPIVISAVGNPHVLKSSLDIIDGQLEAFGIRLEIDTKEVVELKSLK